jgi:hypothetical protein
MKSFVALLLDGFELHTSKDAARQRTPLGQGGEIWVPSRGRMISMHRLVNKANVGIRN